MARGSRTLTTPDLAPVRGPRRPPRARRWPTLLIGALPATFIAVLFLWPVGALIHRAVQASTGQGLRVLLERTDALGLLGVTLGQALASTLLAAVVALPVLWLVARVDLPGSTLLMVIVTIPFVLPTVVVGIVFRALLTGPLDFLGIGSGFWAILAAHAFLNVAVIVRIVGAAWRSIDPRVAAAARSLGASGTRAFLTVVAPRLAPAFGAAAALVFLFCSTSFGVIIILGDGRLRTLETEIYTQAISYFRIPEAVVLSMIQIVVVVAALLLTRVFGDASATGSASGTDAARIRPRGWQWIPALTALAYTLTLLLGPLLVLVVRSLHPTPGGGWTLEGYRALGRPINGVTPVESLGHSLLTAGVAMVIALIVGVTAAIALHRATGIVAALGNLIAMIPLGISAVTLGFGYLIVLASLPSQVSTSFWVIPCVQALIAIPIVIRVLLPALDSVPERARQAATTLGASPWRVFWTIDAPMTGRAFGAAGAFAFVMAFGEFGATGFLARPDSITLPVLIGTALNRPGAENLATAMAASTVMVAVTAVAVVAVELLRPRTGAGI